MEHRPTFDELMEMARSARAGADLRAVDEANLARRITGDFPAATPVQPVTYNPALSAATIRADAEAKYRLMEPIEAGAEAVELGFYRLARLNALLSAGLADPAMLELKEEYERGLLYRIRRYMRPELGVTEQTTTVQVNRQRRQY